MILFCIQPFGLLSSSAQSARCFRRKMVHWSEAVVSPPHSFLEVGHRSSKCPKFTNCVLFFILTMSYSAELRNSSANFRLFALRLTSKRWQHRSVSKCKTNSALISTSTKSLPSSGKVSRSVISM